MNVLNRNYFEPNINDNIIWLINEEIKHQWTGSQAIVSANGIRGYLRSNEHLLAEWNEICALGKSDNYFIVPTLSEKMLLLKRTYEMNGWHVQIDVDCDYAPARISIKFA